MTTLTFGKKKMVGPLLGGDCAFPAMREPIKSTIDSELGEDDGLFINFGMYQDSLPYTMQDGYDTAPVEQEFTTAVLENDHIRATFVLELGARLWSIYDKDGRRDLVTDNPEFRPNNLAIRNAWFAGGIEYNIGRRGHDAQTCSPRFVAELKDTDGTPVLRIYEFDRNRAVPFQLDYYLPADSKYLLMRARIVNVNPYMVPMYWWSNIAVPQLKGQRIVLPCYDTYANQYNNGSHFITRINLPDGDGYDGTYPENFPIARDYFFNIPDDVRKFETVMMPESWGGEAGVSHGFLFASTKRLQGRKLFVWGNCQGGLHWQRKLMGKDEDYLEIQGGLAKTQQECLPMPPKTAWEWLEAYGPVSAPASEVFGTWDSAVKSVWSSVDNVLPADYLEAELKRTGESFAKKPGVVRFKGAGWGALEERRLGHRLAEHLDFGEPGAGQADWLALLETGTMPADAPMGDFLIQDEWVPLLASAEQNWKTYLHRALMMFRAQDYERALNFAETAFALNKNAWTAFVKANLLRVTGKPEEAIDMLIEVLSMRTFDAALAKEILKVLIELKCDPARILATVDMLDDAVNARPMVIYCRAYALAHLGRLDEAEALITVNDGLEIPDIREGEISISDLYIFIQVERARMSGIQLAAKDVDVPFKLDLRMH